MGANDFTMTRTGADPAINAGADGSVAAGLLHVHG